MRVYRVETENGAGPYNPEAVATPTPAQQKLCSKICWDSEEKWHPSPWSTPLRFNPDDVLGLGGDGKWRFGFESVHDLRRWMDGWGRDLEAAAFYVASYEVPSDFVVRGTCQLRFDQRFALLICRESPTVYFN